MSSALPRREDPRPASPRSPVSPGASSTPPRPSARWSTSPPAVHRAGVRRHQPRRRSSRAPGSPRARSTTTSAASRPSSRRSSRRSRATPPARIRKALRGSRDPWEKALIGLRAFLDDRPGPRLPAGGDPGGPGDPRLRAVPRAGGALQLRAGPGHGPRRARGLHLRPERGDARDLQPDLLRRDVRRRRERELASRTPSSRSPGSRPRSRSSWPGLRTLADSGVELPDPEDLLGAPRTTRTDPARPVSAVIRIDPPDLLVRQQLDPHVTRRHLQRPGGGGELQRAVALRLRPGAAGRPGRGGTASAGPCRRTASRAPGCRPGRGSRRLPRAPAAPGPSPA